jgi:hypothetical protein
LALKLEPGVGGQRPEHPHKADEKEKSLQYADAEIRCELGEQAAILLQALVRLGASLAGQAKLVSSVWLEPEIQKNLGQPLPETDLEALLQPGLSDDLGEENRNDDEEDLELKQEGGGVPSFDRIKEGAIPLVQPYLTEHVGNQHDNDCKDEADNRPTLGPLQHVAKKRVKLLGQTGASCTGVVQGSRASCLLSQL